MKTLKKIITPLLLVVLTMSFSACSKKTPENPKEKEQTENTASEATTTKPASQNISNDLYSYEVLINGMAYSLPTSFSTFEKNGWLGNDFTNTKLEPNQYKLETLKNGNQNILIKIVNFGMDVSPLSQCLVGGVKIESDTQNPGTTISIAKGITIGSTYDQVIAAYGKPSNEYKGDNIIKLTYKSGSYSNYEISINVEDKKVYAIEVDNLAPPKKDQGTSTNTTAPEIVKNYKAPSSIGKDLFSFQVKYGGNYYKLPAPITELTKNGWTLQSNNDQVIPAKSGAVGVELRKDNQVLRTQIHNYSDKGEPLKHCFVTYLEYYNNGAMIPLELPKGISEKSSIDQVIAAYGKPAKVEESTRFKYYIYGKSFEEVTFMTNKSSGKIEKIEVNYSPKELK